MPKIEKRAVGRLRTEGGGAAQEKLLHFSGASVGIHVSDIKQEDTLRCITGRVRPKDEIRSLRGIREAMAVHACLHN